MGGKHLLGVSEDSQVQLMDLDSLKVTHFVCGAHQGSVRNATVDPHCEYLATSGCDGQLKVIKIAENSLVCDKKISKKS